MKRTTSLRRLAVGLVAVAALTGACGGGDDDGGSGDTASAGADSGDTGGDTTVPGVEDASAIASKNGEVPPACDVVDKAMVKEATGLDVTDGQSFAGQTIVCGFPGPGDGSGVIVTLTAYGEAGFDSSTSGWPDTKELSGLGDEARMSQSMHTVTVRKGDAIINISLEYLVAGDATQVEPAGTALAKLILAKL